MRKGTEVRVQLRESRMHRDNVNIFTEWHIRVCGPYQKKFLAVIDKEATISSLINEVSAIFRLNYPHDSLATPFSLSSSKGVLDLHTDIEVLSSLFSYYSLTPISSPISTPPPHLPLTSLLSSVFCILMYPNRMF